MKRRWPLALLAAVLAGIVSLAFVYPHQMVSPGNLQPAHAQLEQHCFACHAPFQGASAKRCIACHAIADIGRMTTRGAPIPSSKGRIPFHQGLVEKDCIACHSEHPTPAFARNRVKPFDHALLVPAVRTQCQNCHAAPADAQHKGLKLPCAQCHQARAWKPATFAHARYFPLTGDHNVTCVLCHPGQDYRQYSCTGCHEHERTRMIAVHREEGIHNIDNCARCHRRGNAEDENGGREGADDD